MSNKNINKENILDELNDLGYTFLENDNDKDLGWLVKTDSFGCIVPGCQLLDTISVNTNHLKITNLKVFPNPTTDIIHFDFLCESKPNERISSL